MPYYIVTIRYRFASIINYTEIWTLKVLEIRAMLYKNKTTFMHYHIP